MRLPPPPLSTLSFVLFFKIKKRSNKQPKLSILTLIVKNFTVMLAAKVRHGNLGYQEYLICKTVDAMIKSAVTAVGRSDLK
jgi:hypothetical protein